MESAGLSELAGRFKTELESTMNFWLTHSHDLKHGGFYTCLAKNGEVYDTTKYCWLQGRQAWMYCKLYNTLPEYHTTQILEAAIQGGEFLLQCVKMTGQERCYFATAENGQPAKLQRKPFSECFYTVAMSELARATGEQKYQVAAENMLNKLIYWIRVDDTELGVPKLPATPPSQELARPMMLLNVLTEFCGSSKSLREKYSTDFDWAVQAILKHSDGHWVREHVAPDGSVLPGCYGRQTTPGHALEAGWFLLDEAATREDDKLKRVAIEQFIEHPYSYGLDPVHGGLFYFLDTDGYPPIQLEWSMKLWWVHCEAMLAFLKAYQASGEKKHWIAFTEMAQLCFTKFSDQSQGEWYGYLTRDWIVNQSFKGGPYKGCFHLPRCLLLCLKALNDLGGNPLV